MLEIPRDARISAAVRCGVTGAAIGRRAYPQARHRRAAG